MSFPRDLRRQAKEEKLVLVQMTIDANYAEGEDGQVVGGQHENTGMLRTADALMVWTLLHRLQERVDSVQLEWEPGGYVDEYFAKGKRGNYRVRQDGKNWRVKCGRKTIDWALTCKVAKEQAQKYEMYEHDSDLRY